MGNRDELKTAVWDSFYDTSYFDILFTDISKRWQIFDYVTRLLVAFTASGSAIAGWALWNQADFKTVWVVSAGVASILSIIHATSNATEKVNTYGKLSNGVSLLSHEYETFYKKLKIYPEFDVDNEYATHEDLRSQFKKILESYSPDFFTTSKLKNNAQTKLNIKLGIKEEI